MRVRERVMEQRRDGGGLNRPVMRVHKGVRGAVDRQPSLFYTPLHVPSAPLQLPSKSNAPLWLLHRSILFAFWVCKSTAVRVCMVCVRWVGRTFVSSRPV